MPYRFPQTKSPSLHVNDVLKRVVVEEHVESRDVVKLEPIPY